MTTRLLVVRHGNTFGPGDIVRRLGLVDIPLVESGLAQGRALGRYLKAEGLIPDIVFTSELQRTQQTAAEALQQAGVRREFILLPFLNEIDYGIDEYKPEEEVVARVGKDALAAWDEDGVPPPGWNVDPTFLIASWEKLAAEARTKYAGKTVMTVTSNGIARFAPHLTGDFEAFRRTHKIKIATGALCRFENDGGALWNCTAWNVKPPVV